MCYRIMVQIVGRVPLLVRTAGMGERVGFEPQWTLVTEQPIRVRKENSKKIPVQSIPSKNFLTNQCQDRTIEGVAVCHLNADRRGDIRGYHEGAAKR